MIINKKMDGHTLTIALEGRLDTKTAPDLEKELKSIDDVKELFFDFSGLEYISSAGLRVLLVAKRTMQNKGDIKVINANEIVREVFDITGFGNLFRLD